MLQVKASVWLHRCVQNSLPVIEVRTSPQFENSRYKAATSDVSMVARLWKTTTNVQSVDSMHKATDCDVFAKHRGLSVTCDM